MALTTRSLALASARRPWTTISVWCLILVVSIGLAATLLSSGLTTRGTFTNNPEAKRGEDLLDARLRGPQRVNEAVIVQSASETVDSAAYRAYVEGLYAKIAGLGPGIVEQSTSFYQSGDAGLVSGDRRTTVLPVVMAGSVDDAMTNIDKVLEVVKEANGKSGFQVYVSGNASIGHDFQVAADKDLQDAEILDIPAALIILVLVFGAVLAAIIPILLAMFAIVAAVGVTAVVGQGLQFSYFVTNMILMMGLAVGIDYTLFIVSRFREERARGLETTDAIGAAASTASRAVFFSGMTVVLALLGMLIIPTSIFRSLALGAIFVVVMAVLASLTLLPAVLRLLGDKVNLIRLPFIQRAQAAFSDEARGGFWDRVARTVMAHPVISVSIAAALLIAASIPYFSMHTGSAGVSTLPDTFQSKQGFLILEKEFGGGRVNPAEVVIDGPVNTPAVQAGVERLKSVVAGDPAFGQSRFVANGSGDLGLVSISMGLDPSSREATGAVKRLRDDYIPQAFAAVPARVLVTGTAAFNADFYALTDHYTPIVFAFVLGLSFVLLTVVFRSLVVPAKAILMNLLSVGSAYGLLVLVSQKGFGADVLGFQQVDTIEAWLPLFLFSVLFGLSMDYHVFLLSRIREHYDETNDNTESVAFGLRSTGRLITGAAFIMVAVFAGFARGQMVMFQQMGFGLAVAVFLDATIVRSVLVPASMKLLGRVNWYLPSVLEWLPRVGGEEERGRTYASESGGG